MGNQFISTREGVALTLAARYGHSVKEQVLDALKRSKNSAVRNVVNILVGAKSKSGQSDQKSPAGLAAAALTENQAGAPASKPVTKKAAPKKLAGKQPRYHRQRQDAGKQNHGSRRGSAGNRRAGASMAKRAAAVAA